MDYYNEPPTNFEARAALAEKHILPVAFANGGVAFGGYLRDHKIRGGNFKDVDLWFKSADAATAFIRALVDDKAFTVTPDWTAIYKVLGKDRGKGHPVKLLENFKWDNPAFVSAGDPSYPFQRMMLFVTREGLMQYTDVVVCKHFPVNDFTCNCVTWDGTTIGAYERRADYANFDRAQGPDFNMAACDSKQAVEDIKAGKAAMLAGYMNEAFSRDFATGRTAKLIAKGFTTMDAPCLEQAKRLEERRLRLIREEAARLAAAQKKVDLKAKCKERIAQLTGVTKVVEFNEGNFQVLAHQVGQLTSELWQTYATLLDLLLEQDVKAIELPTPSE